MATNLQIDEALLAEAQALGSKRTKRETVNEALAEYVQRRKQLRLLEVMGTFDLDPTFDYKQQRRES